MTVESLTRRKLQTADGIIDTFVFDFLVTDADHLIAYHEDDLTAPLSKTTVTGVGNQGGGTVQLTSVPPVGTIILIREVPFTQTYDYTTGGRFPAETHEQLADNAVMMIQELEDESDLSIRLPISTDPSVSAELPPAEALKFFRWNADANAIELININDLSAYAVSDYIQTLLDDENADTAKLTLEVLTALTGSLKLPVGTTAQRDGSPEGGFVRYNTTTGKYEGYFPALTLWAELGGGQLYGDAATKAIFYNAQSIAENITIEAANNAMSAGPITIDTGFTVTVETGARWVIN